LQRLHLKVDAKAEAEGWDYIDGKVSTMALCSLTLQRLANKKVYQKQSNSRCSLGMYSVRQHCVCTKSDKIVVIYIHVWASALLFLIDGQCETPEEWDE